jgi:murein L,D-transpeptidase YafK
MTMRRIVGALAGTLALVLIVLIAWDFIKPVRHVPPLGPVDSRATSILMEKQARRLTLFHGDKVIKTFRVALGGDPIGTKQREGDSRTPEGDYSVDSKNPRSHFHLALHISYPDAADRVRAAGRGVPPGGDIMIHGLPNGLGWLGGLHLWRDWTDGCIAVTDSEIEEIWTLADTGTPIQIRP